MGSRVLAPAGEVGFFWDTGFKWELGAEKSWSDWKVSSPVASSEFETLPQHKDDGKKRKVLFGQRIYPFISGPMNVFGSFLNDGLNGRFSQGSRQEGEWIKGRYNFT